MLIIRRIFGVLLIIASILGLVVSIAGIYLIWQIQPTLSSNLQNMLQLISQTLDTTGQGLVVTQQALKSSVDTIGNLQSTIETTAKTIGSTNPMIDEISSMMAQDLPDTILATQSSLKTAQQSAQVIDGVLGTLSSIPLIGAGIGYNPEVPLSDALGQVADSLEGLPESLSNMEESLKNTQSNVETFQTDLEVMATSVSQIQKSVAQYDQVINGYQQSIGQIKQRLDEISANIPNIVRSVAIGLIAFLVWLFLAQVGLLYQGYEMITEGVKKEEKKEAVKEELQTGEPGEG
jgi:methyl-accepting chemotaxis protein